MKRILFVNSRQAQCSIWNSGEMAYQALRLSRKYQIDYVEIDRNSSVLPTGYDVFLFNYHPITMRWLDLRCFSQLKGLKFTLVLEALPNDPFPLCPRDFFDGYVVLDPTLVHSDRRVFAFPRPLEKLSPTLQPRAEPNDIPVIGSFGLATEGKGFEHVVDAVNQEFDRAIVRINIPFGTFVKNSDKNARLMAEKCRKRAKPGVEVRVTHDYMTKQELVDWCAQNTLNCFLYDRNVPGLSATTDQAILSRRPLIVSQNETFRHILKYICPYPVSSLKDGIVSSVVGVQQMVADWQPSCFAERFEYMLSCYVVQAPSVGAGQVCLRAYPHWRLTLQWFLSGVRGRISLYRNKIYWLLVPLLQEKCKKFESYSQAGEDLIVRALFASVGQKHIAYLDIGANHPEYISNTFLFYKTGSRGVTIEPNPLLYAKHRIVRPADKCLNIGIGCKSQEEADFYVFDGAADGLSTFSKKDAEYWEGVGASSIGRFKVKKKLSIVLKPINDILKEYGIPDFLSIDIEGLDLTVLKTLDFSTYRIKSICVETVGYDIRGVRTRNHEIIKLLLDNGYMIYADTGINTLFVDKIWFESIDKRLV